MANEVRKIPTGKYVYCKSECIFLLLSFVGIILSSYIQKKETLHNAVVGHSDPELQTVRKCLLRIHLFKRGLIIINFYHPRREIGCLDVCLQQMQNGKLNLVILGINQIS
jgi:hypothetical protein